MLRRKTSPTRCERGERYKSTLKPINSLKTFKRFNLVSLGIGNLNKFKLYSILETSTWSNFITNEISARRNEHKVKLNVKKFEKGIN